MSSADNSPSLAAAARQWARDSVRARGLFGSCKYLSEQIWLLVRDSTPERRRSRFGDIEYDCDYGVDTTWARLPLGVRLREIFTERLYQATFPEEFGVMMQYLARVDFANYTFIDMGSGKGRVLLLAAHYPFHEIVGVEVQRELHEAAEGNIKRFDIPGIQCRNLKAVCLDAREYDFPETPLVLYLFNPFPDYVMKTVLDKLERSLEKSPRPVYIIYNTPYDRHLFAGRCFTVRAVAEPKFIVYSNME
jgi:hypothetical protein